jgi:hypothetical protein
MRSSTITIDWEAILILLLIIVVVIAPWLLGWWVWSILAPVTFWEKLVLMMALGVLIIIIYGIELFVVAVVS